MRPSSCSRACSTSTAPRARSGSQHARRRAQAAAGLLVVGLAAAAAVLDRGVRAQPRGAPRTVEQAVADGAGSVPQRPRRATGRAAASRLRPAPTTSAASGRDEELEADEASADRGCHRRCRVERRRAMQTRTRRSGGANRSCSTRCRRSPRSRRHVPDAKTRRLIDWIRENLCPGLPPFGTQPKGAPPAWNERRVLIFTENREGTKRYLQTILEQAIEGTDRADERIEVITGLTSGAAAQGDPAAVQHRSGRRTRCGS